MVLGVLLEGALIKGVETGGLETYAVRKSVKRPGRINLSLIQRRRSR